MKKRILAVLLTLAIVLCAFLLGGCTKEDAYIIFKDALSKTNALDDIDATMKMQVDVKSEGMSLSVPMSVDMKGTGLQSESPLLSSKLSMKMLGQEMKLDMYQEGKTAYITMGDTKYKITVDGENDNEYDYTDDMQDVMQDLPEELFENISFTETEKGQEITVNVPESMFEEIYDDVIESAGATSGASVDDLKVSNTKVTVCINDGYVVLYKMSFKMNMDIEGIKSESDVSASVEYKNIGKKVTVTPPEGYKDYEEYSVPDLDLDSGDTL